jgi:hypothetical protein
MNNHLNDDDDYSGCIAGDIENISSKSNKKIKKIVDI